MAKFISKPIEPTIIEAVQWFPGVEIEGVITNDPFIQSGNWSDRFNDREDVYITINGRKESVREGNWIVTTNGVKSVVTDAYIKQKFQPCD